MRSKVNTLLNSEMLCLYIVGGATSGRSSGARPLLDCCGCGEKSIVHDSSRMYRGVVSMARREESGKRYASVWVAVSSGTHSSTCSWNDEGVERDEIER